jgi:hypothetical protein
LDTNNQEQLIFKHAISTVVMARTMHGERHFDARPAVDAVASPQPVSAASPPED